MTNPSITIQSSFTTAYIVSALHSGLNQLQHVYDLVNNADKLPEDIADAITDIVANALSGTEKYNIDAMLERYADNDDADDEAV